MSDGMIPVGTLVVPSGFPGGGGINDVPLEPPGVVYGRMGGEWVPVWTMAEDGWLTLPGGITVGSVTVGGAVSIGGNVSIGGGLSLGGPLDMRGNPVNNLAPTPTLPNGAAPAQWVLQQIAQYSFPTPVAIGQGGTSATDGGTAIDNLLSFGEMVPAARLGEAAWDDPRVNWDDPAINFDVRPDAGPGFVYRTGPASYVLKPGTGDGGSGGGTGPGIELPVRIAQGGTSATTAGTAADNLLGLATSGTGFVYRTGPGSYAVSPGGGDGNGVTGDYLPLSGGLMFGPINMGGFAINNLAPVPVAPNGAAPRQWVMEEIAAYSLYQGVWNVEANQPDLSLVMDNQHNADSWLAITPDPDTAVTVPGTPFMPGLSGHTVHYADHIIWSQVQGSFAIVRSSTLTLTEAEDIFVSIDGSIMRGPLTLSGPATSDRQAVTFQQLQTLPRVTRVTAGVGLDGGSITSEGTISLHVPVSIAHGGTDATDAASALANLGGVTQQQLDDAIANFGGGGGAVTGSVFGANGLTGGGNVATNPTISLVVPVTVERGGTGATSASGALTQLRALPLAGGTMDAGANIRMSAAGGSWPYVISVSADGFLGIMSQDLNQGAWFRMPNGANNDENASAWFSGNLGVSRHISAYGRYMNVMNHWPGNAVEIKSQNQAGDANSRARFTVETGGGNNFAVMEGIHGSQFQITSSGGYVNGTVIATGAGNVTFSPASQWTWSNGHHNVTGTVQAANVTATATVKGNELHCMAIRYNAGTGNLIGFNWDSISLSGFVDHQHVGEIAMRHQGNTFGSTTVNGNLTVSHAFSAGNSGTISNGLTVHAAGGAEAAVWAFGGFDARWGHIRASSGSMWTWDLNADGGVYVKGQNILCDENIKHDIKPQTGDALGLITKIGLFEYVHEGHTASVGTEEEPPRPGPDEHVSFGFIAQQLQEVMPEAVAREPPRPPGIDWPRYLTIDPLQITAVNTRAIQQLNDIINELRGEVEALKSGTHHGEDTTSRHH